jgi:hypothetical protein
MLQISLVLVLLTQVYYLASVFYLSMEVNHLGNTSLNLHVVSTSLWLQGDHRCDCSECIEVSTLKLLTFPYTVHTGGLSFPNVKVHGVRHILSQKLYILTLCTKI